MKHFTLLIIFTCIQMVLFAKVEPYTNRIFTANGGPLVQIGQSNASAMTGITYSTSNTYLRKINRITLGVDHDYLEVPGAQYDLTVQLLIKRWNQQQSPLADTSITLSIHYSPFDTTHYVDKMLAQFSGAVRMHVKIDQIVLNQTNVNSLPKNVYIQSDIYLDLIDSHIDLNSPLNIIGAVPINENCDGKAEYLEIRWTPDVNVNEYQLEWFHVNNYDRSANQIIQPNYLHYNFKYNSTRISTTDNQYRISLLYDKGWIAYRIRGVYELSANLDDLNFGVWSVPESGTVANIPPESKFQIDDNLEHDGTLNWDYSVTYAEEGKRKEILNYYDGTSKVRQSLTRVSSNEQVIVQEQVYDQFGRPIVNILPTPIYQDEDCGENVNLFRFQSNFNRNMDHVAFSHADVFVDSVNCQVSFSPLSSDFGAALYYSPNNPLNNSFDAYIPDAEGYPYTQTKYANDQSGKILSQSGVGEPFKVGSAHETIYLYGVPNQVELDRMFGSEVGYANHYKKNAVIDPNGQIAVSYLDKSDRVIATALAGNVPSSVGPLNSSSSSTNFEVTAFSTPSVNSMNEILFDSTGIFYSSTLLVTSASDYKFDYSFSIDPLKDSCLPNYCIDCVYDLKYEVLDHCGQSLLQSNAQSLIGKFQVGNNDTLNFHGICLQPMKGTFNSSESVFLDPGTYSINKRLSIHQGALDAYVSLYLDTLLNPCIKTLANFLEEEMHLVDTSDCNMDCESCLTSLGSFQDYLNSGIGNESDYALAFSLCEEMCQGGAVSLCEISYQLMLEDLKPGGQYAQCYDSQNNLQAQQFLLSIFNPNNQLPLAGSFWRNPWKIGQNSSFFEYHDASGQRSKIQVTTLNNSWSPAVFNLNQIYFDPSTGATFIYPENLLNLEDFISYFKDSWASSLVKYHPEYCYYESCIQYEHTVQASDAISSSEFDLELLNIVSRQDALAKGYLQANGIPFNYSLVPTATNGKWDPFTVYATQFESNACPNFIQQFKNKVQNYQTISAVNRSMFEIAAMAYRCQNSGPYTNACFAFGTGTDTTILDGEWNLFKSLYASEKRKTQVEMAECRAIKICGTYGECIGNAAFNAMDRDFLKITSPYNPMLNYFASDQVCGSNKKDLYLGKIRRFQGLGSMDGVDSYEVIYQIYMQTGQCPVDFALQTYLNSLVSSGNLLSNNFYLASLNEYANLMNARISYVVPSVVPNLTQFVQSTNQQINYLWKNGAQQTIVNLQLMKNANSSNVWSNLVGFEHLASFSSTNFRILAVFQVNGSLQRDTLQGTLDYFTLGGCEFEAKCKPNQLAKDLKLLFNVLANTGNFVNQQGVDLMPLNYGGSNLPHILTPTIQSTYSGVTSSYWRYIPSNSEFNLYNPATNDALKFKLTHTTPSNFSLANLNAITHFSTVQPTGENTFEVKAYTGQAYVTLHFVATKFISSKNYFVSLGECSLPSPTLCERVEVQNMKDIKLLLKDVLIDSPLQVNQVNIYHSYQLSTNLKSQLPAGYNSSTSSYTSNLVNGLQEEVLTIQVGTCSFEILHSDALMLNITLQDLREILSVEIDSVAVLNQKNSYNHLLLVGRFYKNGSYHNQNISLYSNCVDFVDCMSCIDNSGSLQGFSSSHLTVANSVPCMESYLQYEECVRNFNSWSVQNNYAYLIDDVISYATFTNEALCNCVDQFCTRLQVVKSGIKIFENEREFGEYISIQDLCLTQSSLCQPPVFNPYFPNEMEDDSIQYVNLCVQNVLDQALMNASLRYDMYIDSIKQEIANRYTRYCLNPQESLSYSFEDNTYHYTLYYYDQAGNLIRTVPPEGVELMQTTSSNDQLSISIANDRQNYTKSVFTAHRLVTRYEYNSLNQLVTQHTPDTDDIELFELYESSGLVSNLTTTQIQMINTHEGYLSGYHGSVGKLYKTTDGGKTWNPLTNLPSEDINRILYLNSNLGLAVGRSGLILKTVNGGTTWQVIDDAFTVTGMMNNLNDMAFFDAGSGNYRGVIVGDNATATKVVLSNTAQVFMPYSSNIVTASSGSASVNKIKSVAYDGTNFVCLVENTFLNDTTSRILSITWSASSWTEQFSFVPLEMETVSMYSLTGGFAAGVDGNLYHNSNLSSTTSRWKHVPSNHKYHFLKLEFLSPMVGGALVAINANTKRFYKTTDGGKNWFPVNNNSFEVISRDNNKGGVLAVGNQGNASVLLADGSHFDRAIANYNVTACWVSVLSNTNIRCVINNYSTVNNLLEIGNIYSYSTAIQAFGRPTTIGVVKQIEGYINTSNAVVLALLTVDDKIYSASLSSNSYTLISGLSSMLAMDIDPTDKRIIAYNGSTSRLSLVSYNSGVLASSFTDANSISPISGTIADMCVYKNGSLIYSLFTSSGYNLTSSSVNPVLTFNTTLSHKLQILPSHLSKIRYTNVNGLMMVGNRGALWQYLAGANNHWRLIETAWINHLSDVNEEGSKLWIGGNMRLFASAILSSNPILSNKIVGYNYALNSNQPVGIYDNSYFRSISVLGSVVYVISNDGLVYYKTTANQFGVLPVTYANLIDVAIRPNTTQATVVGGAGKILIYNGSVIQNITNIQAPKLVDVHFYDNNHGTIISSSGYVRITSNGGYSWTTVIPEGYYYTNVEHRRALTLSPTERLVVGKYKQYRISPLSNGFLKEQSLTGNPEVYSIKSIDYAKLYLGGDNKLWVVRLDNSTNFQILYNNNHSNVQVNAIHVFQNESYAIAGSQGKFGYFNLNGTSIIPLTVISNGNALHALSFIDKTNGIIVGENGTFIRLKDQISSSNGYLQSTNFAQQAGIYTLGVDPLSVYAANQIHLYAVAYTSVDKGVFGGVYNTAYHTANPTLHSSYVRYFNQQNEHFATHFFYDGLGRLIASRNSRQYNSTQRKYSYTLYDGIGRVFEAGEKTENSQLADRFQSVYGDSISGHYNPNAISYNKFVDWVNGDGPRKEVTRSYYDESTIAGLPQSFLNAIQPSTQRLRIIHTTYEDVYDGNDQTYEHASHYSYDIHGNVRTIVKDNLKLATTFPSQAGQRFKTIDYRYDLVSGNVHRVSVESNQADQWHHAYEYDADNRLIGVYTNKHTPITSANSHNSSLAAELIYNQDWEKEASYEYYLHGPLARVEIGNRKVQGVDYMYNLQGWIKGVNSSHLDSQFDPGQDGNGNGNRKFIPTDVYGYALHYYSSDYLPIAPTYLPIRSVLANSNAAQHSDDLFNGNIRFMETAIMDIGKQSPAPMLNSYRYDQLQRLSQSRSYEHGYNDSHWNPNSYQDAYYNAFTYDAMGNILTQDRHDRYGGKMEELEYHYQRDSQGNLLRNRLYHVNDHISAGDYLTDIDDQGAFISNPSVDINLVNNYTYDEEGRLIRDKAEEIAKIEWTVSGKVKNIIRTAGSTRKNLSFDYDAMGKRIAKHVYSNLNLSLESSTYYLLDAQGNVMNTYRFDRPDSTSPNLVFSLEDRVIYGSSRLGQDRGVSGQENERVIGQKRYELNNHLGNVLTVLSDLKTPVRNGNILEGFTAQVYQVSDYSPFGVELDGRTMSWDEVHPIQSSAPEPVTNVLYQHNFDVGATTHPYFAIPTTIDASLSNSVWTNSTGSFTNLSGSPISGRSLAISSALSDTARVYLTMDIAAGKEMTVKDFSFSQQGSLAGYTDYRIFINGTSVGSGSVYLLNSGVNMQNTGSVSVSSAISCLTGQIAIELRLFGGSHSNSAYFQLDNFVLRGYVRDVQSEFVARRGYRYGFNGMEKDDEAKGAGNSYTTEFRQYDPRLGRWLSIDPKASSMPWQSPYCTMDNNPIIFNDVLGDSTKFKIIETGEEHELLDGSDKTFDISQKDFNDLKFLYDIDECDLYENHLDNLGLGTVGYDVALWARSKIGSTEYAFDVKKGDFPPNTDKCNKFVYDAYREFNAIEKYPLGSPPRAGAWANEKIEIRGMEVVTDVKLGDVIAGKFNYPNGASGHVEIVTNISPFTGEIETTGAGGKNVRTSTFGQNVTSGEQYNNRTYSPFSIRRSKTKK